MVFLKLRADATYFLTPDSHYYLEAAQNLLNGKGYRIVFEEKDTFCAIWPVGYSALIALVSWLTTSSLETASKLVNLLALAGCFWLIWQRYRDKAWFVALAFSTTSLVQLYTNTWSETVFLFFVLGFCISSFSGKEKEVISVFWAIGAFLTRYAGVFLLIPLLIQRKFRAVAYYLVFISGYVAYNFYQTNTFTGGHGFWPQEPFGERILRGLRGLGEEVLFFAMRDWDLKSTVLSDSIKWFIYGVALLQFLIVGLIVWRLYKEKDLDAYGMTKSAFFLVAISYLVFIIGIYLTDASVESLYFRRLAPASLLLTLGLLAWVSSQKILFERTKWYFVIFFVLSIIHSIPKTY